VLLALILLEMGKLFLSLIIIIFFCSITTKNSYFLVFEFGMFYLINVNLGKVKVFFDMDITIEKLMICELLFLIF
jgi:hypothetical protein